MVEPVIGCHQPAGNLMRKLHLLRRGLALFKQKVRQQLLRAADHRRCFLLREPFQLHPCFELHAPDKITDRILRQQVFTAAAGKKLID